MIRNGIKQSAAYWEELQSIIPSYLEGLLDGLGEGSKELDNSLEGIFSSEEMEKICSDLGDIMERVFVDLDEE